MTPEERQQMMDLCKRLHDETDQRKIIALAEELNRFLDNQMPLKAKKQATGA